MSASPAFNATSAAIAGHARRYSQPLVGIGVPVFNGARFLRYALDSLLVQTLGDFEIVISDNTSTDETPAICAEYVARDSRVTYFRQPQNVGLPRNWNFVAQEARGKYFKWASANDFFAPDALETCVRVLESEPDAVLAFGRTNLVGADGELLEAYTGDFAVPCESPSARYRFVCENMALNNAISGVIRREALQRTGLVRPYPASDIVLMAELALQGRFRLVSQTTLFRRADATSMSSRLTHLELMRLHNPRSSGGEWVVARKHRDLIAVTLTSKRLALPERLKSLLIAMRHSFWTRRQILGEIAASVRHLLSPKRFERSG